jgi:excinuclease UvrABC nuclease subunit
MSYVYKFIDNENNVIYVGRTENITRRITKEHFTKNGHLPKTCYDKCCRIEYAKVKSLNESRLYELYLISKYKPEYNSVFSEGGELTFELPSLEWVKWEKEQRNIVIADIESFGSELEKATNSILSLIRTMEVFDFVVDINQKHRDRFKHVIAHIKNDAESINTCKQRYLKSS